MLVCELPGYERGRKSMAVPALIHDIAIAEGVPKEAITVFRSPPEGVQDALAEARQGDCLVLLALTQRDEVLTLIRKFMA